MGLREYDYIRGNTAVKPERKIQEREKVREHQHKRREAQRRLHEKQVNAFKSVLSVAGLVFVLGVSTLGINNYVYKLQNNLSKLETSVKEQKDISEALKVEMLKYASLDTIKSTAENKLSMVYPKEDNYVTIDMSKEYFSHLKTDNEKKKSFIAKIMDTFN